MTLDYGVRMTHAGAVYEVRRPELGLRPGALVGVQRAGALSSRSARSATPGNQSCSSANQRARRSALPGRVRVARPSRARRCRASARSRTACGANGLANHPTNPDSGKKDGWYYDLPIVSYAPRVGLAWDVFGDGKTAVRASGGIFYNFVNTASTSTPAARSSAVSASSATTTLDDDHRRCRLRRAFAEKPADRQPARRASRSPATRADSCRRASSSRNELPGQPRVPARHRLQHRRRGRVGRRTSAGSSGARRRPTTSRSTRTGTSNNLFNNQAIAANFLRRSTRAWAGQLRRDR